jgi:hypothetical protein
MRLCLEELYENTADFRIQEYRNSFIEIGKFFQSVGQNNTEMTASVTSLIYSANAYLKEGYDMTALLEKLEASPFKEMNAEDSDLLQKTWRNNNSTFKPSIFYKYSKMSDERLQKRLDKHAYQLAKLHHGVSQQAEISPQGLKKIRAWKKRIKTYYNFSWLTRLHKRGKGLYDNKADLIQDFVQIEAEVKRLEDVFFARKNELGLVQLERIAAAAEGLDVAEQSRAATMYANRELAVKRGASLPVVSLGWCNLDKVPPKKRMLLMARRRVVEGVLFAPLAVLNVGTALANEIDGAVKEARFNNIHKRTVELTVNAEEKNNTAVFVVFKNQKTVIRANANNLGAYAAGRQFKEDQVKIIGFRIQGKDAELFIEEGPVSKLNGMTATFQKKSMDEIEAVLAEM